MANAKHHLHHLLSLLLLLILSSVPPSTQLQSSQAWSLLQLQHLLNYPPVLSTWNNYSDACYSDPTPTLTVVCYEESVTQLHIAGQPGSPRLPANFSIDPFFTTLTRLPDLKVLSLTSLGLWGALPAKLWRLSNLEILNVSSNYLYGSVPREVSHLWNLQTLILDHNYFTGSIPDRLSELSLLTVLSMRNNSLSGPLPDSIATLQNLRILSLAANNLSGSLPDLSGLSNLQVLDLENNQFGPQFPNLQRKVATVLLHNNRFTGALPADVTTYYMLRDLDVSSNRFVGPFPTALLSLPSVRYLNISGNRFTGMLFQNMSCGDALQDVDLSSNLLTGSLPLCLLDGNAEGGRNVTFAMNCLATKGQIQHPFSVCQTEALAVGVLPRPGKKSSSSTKVVVVTTLVVGLIVVAVVATLLILILAKRMEKKRAMRKVPRRLVEHASNAYPSKLLSDARYISQTMKLGALGIPPYRSFSLEELVAATNNFDSTSFLGEGSNGQMYRGQLKDGSTVAIRCLKLKRSRSSQNFTCHIELFAKLRHRHLVSALGHCFEYYLEDSTVSSLYLIFEYVPNGTLRNRISEGVAGHKLTWTQRISAAVGVAKGIEFLHTGIIPGLFGNKLSTANILLDQNLFAKISSYNLPVLQEVMKNELTSGCPFNGSKERKRREIAENYVDMYDFGAILLEIITGNPVCSNDEIDTGREQLRSCLAADGAARRRGVVDPAVSRTCSNESLRTVIEICIRCLSVEPTERPSVEDVLWNLQFAIQVQDSWRGDSQSSDGSFSPSHLPPLL